MIPHIPNQRQFKSNASKPFDDLVKYIEGDKEQEKLQEAQQELSSQFDDILNYATSPTDKKTKAEKCIAMRTHGVYGLSTASAEMNAVSRKNTRCHDPAYHIILSWPEHEQPAPEAIFDAAEHAIKALGMAEHQYVLAIHGNTDNMHCHISVNRVHPVTFKSRHIEWAARTLHMAARQSEIKHGWTHDNGIYIVETDGRGKKHIILNPDHANVAGKTIPHTHRDLGNEEKILPTWHDPDSLDSWLKSNVARDLKRALPDLTSWQALHAWLDNYEITLSDSGGGGMRLHATSPESGEILDIAASKGLRILKRGELEKRWGKFANIIHISCITPELSHLTPNQLAKGVQDVLNRNLDHGDYEIPADYLIYASEHTGGIETEGSSGLHELPAGGMDGDGQHGQLLVSGSSPEHLGDIQTGQNPDLRRAGPNPDGGGRQSQRGSQSGSESDGQGGSQNSGQSRGQGEGQNGSGGQSQDQGGREGGSGGSQSQRGLNRDDTKRAERKEQRAAARADLRHRFSQYKRFVRGGDTEHFLRAKEIQTERSETIKQIREQAKAAKAAIPKSSEPAVRLVSNVEIDAESLRRKLQAEATFQDKSRSLRATRTPPLTWRAWLYEQANLGDQAALSALRGIVYQAQRDAKAGKGSVDDEETVFDEDTAEYRERQYKKVMARLLEEETKEAALRSANSNFVRPYEADAILARYNGIQWRVTGNGNVEYSDRDGGHLFTDRGNRVTFDRVRVTDDEIRLALAHAQQKFGKQITLTGDDAAFSARMARLGDDMGLTILNPELQVTIANYRVVRELEIIEATTISVSAARAEKDMSSPDKSVNGEPLIQSPPLHQQTPERPNEDAAPIAQPDVPAVKTPQEQLRAIVLSIDPRATFALADPSNSQHLYVGVVAASLQGADQEFGFAQHVGRSVYTLHPGNLQAGHNNGVIEIRYRDGQAIVTAQKSQKGKGRAD